MRKLKQNYVDIGPVKFGNDLPIVLILGPCQLESRDHALFMAEQLKLIGKRLDIGVVYKTSFDKANRTSAKSPLQIFREIKSKFNLPVLADIHE